MENKFKCQACGGSGRIEVNPDDITCAIMPELESINKPCPSCNEGYVMIEVAVPSKHEGDTGYYRPLTGDELTTIKVESSFGKVKLIDLIMIVPDWQMLWHINYKDQPVKLSPWRE